MNLTYDLWNETYELYERIVDYYGTPLWWGMDAPDLVLYYDPEDDYGWHFQTEIGLNYAACEDWADVVGTLIHEYAHHCQSPNWMDEAAYEEEAQMIAMRDLPLFMPGVPA